MTYKYYEIALGEDIIEKVNTMEQAEELCNIIKNKNLKIQELKNEDSNTYLNICEKYTQNSEELVNIDIAKQEIESKTQEIIKKQEDEAEQKRIDSMPNINGIKIAIQPISGIITSRYGVSSSIRSSNHTGLDIAAQIGTPIKVVADGIVTSATYSGSYGNLVKIDHGNNVETWYAHTSKMYVNVGQQVKAGDIIAAVGSTGNSTGAHLHLEIRINGNHVNPQNYLYK